MYGRLGKDPQRAEHFGAGMSAVITSEGYELHHIVDRTPWASFGSVTVVDLGGSRRRIHWRRQAFMREASMVANERGGTT